MNKPMIDLTMGLIAMFSVLSVGGCATLSKQECLMGDWQSIGYADGVAGYSGARLQSHHKACAKAGVSPNLTQWEAGRQQGLKQYCTATNAYKRGRQGSGLNTVCPTNQTAQLERINRDGQKIYQYQQQINQEKEQLKKLLSEYEQLKTGSNLDFKSETDARVYLLSLPNKINDKRISIAELNRKIAVIQSRYGY